LAGEQLLRVGKVKVLRLNYEIVKWRMTQSIEWVV